MTNVMDKLLKSIGLKKFFDLEIDSYVQLTQEFYYSLVMNETDKHALDFSMLGNTYKLTRNFMKNVFGFAKDGVRKMSSDFSAHHFWAFFMDLPFLIFHIYQRS